VRQANYFFETGEFARAESLYFLALKKRTHPDDLAELNLNLGYLAWRIKGDFKKGNELLNAAWGSFRQARSDAPGIPTPYWRLGELFLYKNFTDSAEANLKFALYLETRPYYMAKIFIRLGNLYDVLNQRQKAIEHYRQVLQMSAAPLDRRRAQAYLSRPFRLGSP
jgi:tetratricopeptide (TPR) repeat protein